MTYQIETNNWFVLKVINLFYRLGALKLTTNAQEPQLLISKSEFFEELSGSFEEVKLYKQGKIQLKNARVAMQEIEKELANE